jgi:CO/xanthine dehydrogenase FAD-binding subunit
MLAREPALAPLAGGTDLLVHWPCNLDGKARDYLDLSRLRPAHSAIVWDDDRVTLGPLTTYWDVITDRRLRERFPILIEAARQVGAVQIQTQGTWAGNIANASPVADGVPVLMACDARVELRSAHAARTIALDRLYTGYRRTRREPGQLITGIVIPLRRYDTQFFEKVGSRRAQAITKVGVAVTHADDTGWRVIANAMAPVILRCAAVEALLESVAPIRTPEDLLPAIDADMTPISDLRSTAPYRRAVFARILFHALRQRRVRVTTG